MNIKDAIALLADNDNRDRFTRYGILFLALFILVFWWRGYNVTDQTHLEKVLDRGVLKVITRPSPTTYYESYGGPDGLEYQLASRFAESLGVRLEIEIATNITTIMQSVNDGDSDLAAAGLSMTPERRAKLNFGSPYQEVSPKLVFKQGKRWPRNINQLTGDLMIMADSAHAQDMLNFKREYPALRWSETGNFTSEDLLGMVLDESIDYTIADSNELALNRRFYPELAIAFSIGQTEQIAWAFSKHQDDSLRAAAIAFFDQFKQSGDLAQLIEKYYGHIEDFDYVGTRTFLKATESKLPRFLELFKKYSDTDLDWRLLAAISYQESHWNPKARSPTGVRGLMMLTLRTAKQLGIKSRIDPEQSIRGGAKYLLKVKRRIPKRITEPDRTWLALAAYNIGYGHVEDARRITEKLGADPDRWVDVKEYLPLLRQRKYYKFTRYGYARGDEPVRYVDNIRRYYETLVWLTNSSEENNFSANQLVQAVRLQETDKDSEDETEVSDEEN
ncbi:MAG: membrane-bound lytic murein transglycosylase MltF [Gammaproteobacteria bacterium]|nr:membrane-bound lytic murein transglycosylase MltF [Gammaproteobacteria bacterium]NNJ72467.1 membrane-bound lytic murein transglycosylase MltF [Enterobacterales bacterium]